MKILALDSSNQSLSVALVEESRLLAETLLTVKKNHSVSLMPVIDFLMKQVGWLPKELDRIVVAHGPGSYTGLRIGVATAKTLAYTLGIDLVGISSLKSLVPNSTKGLVVPLINARRNHVYTGFYEDGKSVRADGYQSFESLLAELASYEQVTFVGEVTAFIEQIKQSLPTALYEETFPSAYQLAVEGARLLPDEVMLFEPQYLKKVEAEENWLKEHDDRGRENYIQRV